MDFILIVLRNIGSAELIFPLCKGIFLAFDSKTREYIGLEMFYLPKNQAYIDRAADNLINELLRNGVLEYIED